MSIEMDWFEKGRNSILRQNRSGCCCKFNEEDTEIVSVCEAYKELINTKVAKLEAEKLELIQAQREQADKYLAMKDKLEAENKRLRELAYKIWVHQSWADNPRIEFDIWLEQALKEE